VLRKIFGATRDKIEVIGDQGILHNEKIIICAPHQNFWVKKSRRIRWAVHVARTVERRDA
jgi:hypothetical protein